ncbi:MAG TPA: type II secretion system protein [Candidatus Saccharimonadales bacterium]|jgi:prepilin-type N-terminal cleavage/methylation domain-containing protein|nr:type II secretion system protein [Candidatus Saccharimonadales bacterium]
MWGKTNKPKYQGFTIVELLIVIVVIGILAAITIVAYNGVQQRGRDVKRKDDVAKIVHAGKLWLVDSGKQFNELGGGSSGSTLGWFDSPYSPYPSVKSVFVSGGFLAEGVTDPINRKTGTIYAYMIAPCNDGDNTTRVALAKLEIPPAETVSQQLVGYTCAGSHLTTYTSASYGMNYARIIDGN